MLKNILSCIVVLLLFAGTALAAERTEVPIGDSPSMGPNDAAVTIIEFIDFQ